MIIIVNYIFESEQKLYTKKRNFYFILINYDNYYTYLKQLTNKKVITIFVKKKKYIFVMK